MPWYCLYKPIPAKMKDPPTSTDIIVYAKTYMPLKKDTSITPIAIANKASYIK